MRTDWKNSKWYSRLTQEGVEQIQTLESEINDLKQKLQLHERNNNLGTDILVSMDKGSLSPRKFMVGEIGAEGANPLFIPDSAAIVLKTENTEGKGAVSVHKGESEIILTVYGNCKLKVYTENPMDIRPSASNSVNITNHFYE